MILNFIKIRIQNAFQFTFVFLIVHKLEKNLLLMNTLILNYVELGYLPGFIALNLTDFWKIWSF
jgi:hypothetical protein